MNIIPKARKCEHNGTLHIPACFLCDSQLSFCQKAFLRVVHKIYGIHLKKGDNGIKLRYDTSVSKDEFRINGETIYASDCEGARYGLATMLQLIELEDEEILLQNINVTQKPDKEYRAFMADLGRQWHPFETIIGYVDLCFINKLKYLQLHFSDNSLWTLKLNSFPKLGKPESSYTKEKIMYLVEYAHEAGIELVPEFEGIGHSKELIEVYPELFGNEFVE